MLLVLFLCTWYTLPCVIISTPTSFTWESFKESFNKSYDMEVVESKRRDAWEENIRTIREHNAEYAIGKSLFKCGQNDLADLPQMLYLKMHVRLTPSAYVKAENDVMVGALVPDPSTVPNELDWRTSGFDMPPSNQKSCGSCYAYSIAHSVSGQIFKRTGRNVMLSEQQIVDCSVSTGNHGCAGGSLRNTLKYLEGCGGLMRQVDYPYTATVFIKFKLITHRSHFKL